MVRVRGDTFPMIKPDEWLALFVDSLPEPESFVITELFWHRASLAQVGRELGISKRSVVRLRTKALERLSAIEGLSEWVAELSTLPDPRVERKET